MPPIRTRLYGALYKYDAPRKGYRPGTMMPVYEWDTGRYLGDIPQAAHTYSTVGNMNDRQLIIAETTYGGRPELADPDGGIDYGSLIYITLQRAATAREAIATIVEPGQYVRLRLQRRIVLDSGQGRGVDFRDDRQGEQNRGGSERQQRHRLGSPPYPRRLHLCACQPGPHHAVPA